MQSFVYRMNVKETNRVIFILDQDYALRSWRWVPYAVYKKYTPNAAPIAKEAFSLLLQCDGQQDIPDSELLSQLLQRGLIHPAAPGEKLSSWQNYMDCDNRYMPQVYLSLTGKCNFNCRHCFNAADNAPLMSEWDYETYLHFLDECRDCGVHAFFITGGEPMLHPRFMDMMRAIHERGMYVFRLNTNGAFLTEAVLDEMKSFGCIPEMWLSFDGIGWHDWMRGRKGAEEQALSSIRLCIEKGIPTGVHVNAHRGNKEVIPDTIRMLDDMGVKFTRVLRTTEAPRWEQNAQGMTLSFEEYYDLCLSLIHEYARSDSSMDLRLWQFIFLDAADIAGSHLARQVRILAEIFKVASTTRISFDINTRSKDDVDAIILSFFRHRITHLL